MASSTATAWPSPGRFALVLALGFALTLAAVWGWGTTLIEAILPVTRIVLGWIDGRFGILFLGVDHDAQDTIVRLRVGLDPLFVMAGRVLEASPEGWLAVTTTTGAILQPLTIAPALALALPATPLARLFAFGLAATLAFLFMLLDLPLTLFAYVWDMMIDSLEPGRTPPLLVWHAFLHAGGRLGVALVLGVLAWWMVRQGGRVAAGPAQG
jgi:hypothetical protein